MYMPKMFICLSFVYLHNVRNRFVLRELTCIAMVSVVTAVLLYYSSTR